MMITVLDGSFEWECRRYMSSTTITAATFQLKENLKSVNNSFACSGGASGLSLLLSVCLNWLKRLSDRGCQMDCNTIIRIQEVVLRFTFCLNLSLWISLLSFFTQLKCQPETSLCYCFQSKVCKNKRGKKTQLSTASSAACNDRTSMTSCVFECGALVMVPCISSKYQWLSGTHKLSSAMEVRCSRLAV